MKRISSFPDPFPFSLPLSISGLWTPGDSSPSNKGKNSTNDFIPDLRDRELTPLMEDILLDASCLIRKAAVLSQRAAKSCKYASRDSDVFVSSACWEKMAGGGDDDDDNEEEDEDDEEEDAEAKSRTMMMAMSQDY